jgi:hypothetical protein
MQRTYGIRPRTVYHAIASGEFFARCGAQRRSIEVDFRDGGRFTTSIATGRYTRISEDTVELRPDGGPVAVLTVGGQGLEGTLRLDGGAPWTAGLDALAPSPERFDADADERQTYDEWLDFYRGVLPGKLRGLSEVDARRSFVGSATTLLGLARHLTAVEREWFQLVLGRRAPQDLDPNHTGGAASWELGPRDTIASVLAEYASACAESRREVVRHELDDVVPKRRGGSISVRMIYTHLIEEIARHAGHADILRELVDGSTGVDPG